MTQLVTSLPDVVKATIDELNVPFDTQGIYLFDKLSNGEQTLVPKGYPKRYSEKTISIIIATISRIVDKIFHSSLIHTIISATLGYKAAEYVVYSDKETYLQLIAFVKKYVFNNIFVQHVPVVGNLFNVGDTSFLGLGRLWNGLGQVTQYAVGEMMHFPKYKLFAYGVVGIVTAMFSLVGIEIILKMKEITLKKLAARRKRNKSMSKRKSRSVKKRRRNSTRKWKSIKKTKRSSKRRQR